MSDRWNESLSLRKETTLLWRLGERDGARSLILLLDLSRSCTRNATRVDEESSSLRTRSSTLTFLFNGRIAVSSQEAFENSTTKRCSSKSMLVFFFFFFIHQSCYGGNEVYRFKKIAFSLTFALSLSLSLSLSLILSFTCITLLVEYSKRIHTITEYQKSNATSTGSFSLKKWQHRYVEVANTSIVILFNSRQRSFRPNYTFVSSEIEELYLSKSTAYAMSQKFTPYCVRSQDALTNEILIS